MRTATPRGSRLPAPAQDTVSSTDRPALSRLFDTDKDRRLSRDYGYTHSTTYGYSSTTGLPSSDSLISISGSTYTSLTRSYTHDTIGRPLTASRSGVTTAFGYGGFGKLADRM